MSTFRNTAGPLAACVMTVSVLAACEAPRPAPGSVYDPYEAENRETHEINKAVDAAAFRGEAKQPGPIGQGVANVGHNLGLPRMVVNSVLQGRPEPAVKNTLRFAINTTLGVGGLFDPAGHWFNLPEETTDFGETLHVWGVREGAYMELPLIGPSTERDTVGKIVDVLIDPVGHVLSGNDLWVARAFRLGARSVDRKRYGATVDSVLHESADSYAQSRLLYLQNRRHKLSGAAASDETVFDPYEDPYGE